MFRFVEIVDQVKFVLEIIWTFATHKGIPYLIYGEAIFLICLMTSSRALSFECKLNMYVGTYKITQDVKVFTN